MLKSWRHLKNYGKQKCKEPIQPHLPHLHWPHQHSQNITQELIKRTRAVTTRASLGSLQANLCHRKWAQEPRKWTLGAASGAWWHRERAPRHCRWAQRCSKQSQGHWASTETPQTCTMTPQASPRTPQASLELSQTEPREHSEPQVAVIQNLLKSKW